MTQKVFSYFYYAPQLQYQSAIWYLYTCLYMNKISDITENETHKSAYNTKNDFDQIQGKVSSNVMNEVYTSIH